MSRGVAARDGEALRRLATRLERLGASLRVEAPGLPALAIGPRPGAARVVFHTPDAVAALPKHGLLGLAEAFLEGHIDIQGDLLEVMKLTELLPPRSSLRERLRLGLRLLLGSRRKLQRESIAFHYDRPPEFFLPWFERWRSYSHGFYETATDPPQQAQARKLQFAIDALGLEPGDEVFDMGCGWGSFLEYAGLQGIRVHGITISREQHRFVERLIRSEGLPCRVECVDLLDFRPGRRFGGAVFMGTFEHFPAYGRAARFLARHLDDGARLYADFCSQPGARHVGDFLARHIWPGTAMYVSVRRLTGALERAGFALRELEDDTRSYALTVRDWANAFELERKALAERFGEAPVRAFLLYLRASQYYLERGKTRAHHLVAGRKGLRA